MDGDGRNPNVGLCGELTDEMILTRIRDRDTAALEELYDRYARQAFALAYRMLGSREVAEEVTQDAFMSVWRQAATYNAGVGRVKPWLLSIVHHRAIDRVRRVRERQPTAQLDEAWMKTSETDVFRDVYRGVQRAHIQRALLDLPRDSARQSSWRISAATASERLLRPPGRRRAQ